ncbi:hypothetical protein [Oceanidesulfovibrio marinus]|uniref:Uncharacterized protein n=1 Tax=Oceanidesulfovibrio marinus TaxID=370038 RepID=A0A6P1ZFK7_9BACT|nr:hypothetical protein [Oceanidesulfovibrio marinus]TVM31190.1 hypothetical protein DQK91_18950 [Oceanidesulfovibrio marinus]
MTRKQLTAYTARPYCPVCGDQGVETWAPKPDYPREVTRTMRCTYCRSTWQERYTLSGIDIKHRG